MTELTTAFLPNSTAVAMSSLEIAEITGKNHADVMRDIRVMMDQLAGDASKFAGYYIAANGKQNPCFFLPEEEMLTLVSGYRVDLRRAIITRWKALEAGTAEPVQINFADPAVLAGMLDHLQTQVDTQKAQLEAQAPKVLAQERLEASEGSVSISDAARMLGMAQRTFFAWLTENGWIFRAKDRPKRPVPYADKRRAGLMEVVTSTQWSGGAEVATQSCYITAKGVAKLAEAMGNPYWR